MINNKDHGRLLFLISHYENKVLSLLENNELTNNTYFYKKLKEYNEFTTTSFSDYSSLLTFLLEKVEKENKTYIQIISLILSIKL